MRKPRRNHQIPMREDSKMNGKPSNSYEKRSGKALVNHQILMRKDQKTCGKHQIPMREDGETT